MLIYHGTTESAVENILNRGIRPRGRTGTSGNWEKAHSNKELVYLSSCYAPYFGHCALKEGDRVAVIEIDTDKLDESCLVPDEDFLEQATRGVKINWVPKSIENADMTQRTKWFKRQQTKLNLSSLWKESLNFLGTVAYKGTVPSEAITRISLFDPSKNRSISGTALDPTITLINFKIMYEKYRALTEWIMGDDVETGRIFRHAMLEGEEEHLKAAEEVLADRSCLEQVYPLVEEAVLSDA